MGLVVGLAWDRMSKLTPTEKSTLANADVSSKNRDFNVESTRYSHVRMRIIRYNMNIWWFPKIGL